MATLDNIRAYSPYTLAKMAGCASPDGHESEGAEFLRAVRSDFVEAVEHGRFDTEDVNDVASESAGSTPDPMARTRWLEYVDLAAYSEEEETGEGWPSDPFAMAGVALYQIAYRLFMALALDLDEDEGNE
jgi:hypothetical protein